VEQLTSRTNELAVRAAELAAAAEEQRRMPPPMVEALREAGLFRMLVPDALGGGEAPPAELIDAVETIAEGDGSAAWCLAVVATSGLLAAYLPEGAAREIFGDPDDMACGVFAPRGKATLQPGGDYLVSGHWQLASGCQFCNWIMGGCVVLDGEEVRMLPTGRPDVRLAIFPAEEVEITDTWRASGLRGTGSHDFGVDAVAVAAEHTASLITDPPREQGPLYAFPAFGLLALAISAVGLGMARGSIKSLRELAPGRKTPGSQRSLAERDHTRAEVARAEARLRAARALIDEAIGEAWETAAAGDGIDVEQRVALRLAATHAMDGSREVIDRMYELGGSSSVYDTSPQQRRLRDVHVAAQHMLVAAPTWELAGRHLLGQEIDPSQL
jgi:alkylation response protein AidB-like acyl-CoA dehydrogenase